MQIFTISFVVNEKGSWIYLILEHVDMNQYRYFNIKSFYDFPKTMPELKQIMNL